MPASSYLPHHMLLRDEERTNSYRNAVAAVVKPSDVVYDLGCGTGVLAIEAARAGAKHVYAVEIDPATAMIARQLIAENAFSDVITVIDGASQEVNLPEKVDVLVSDVTGFFGISQEMEAFFRARDEWLKPEGRVVPESIDLFVAPVEAADVYGFLDMNGAYNLSTECLRQLSLNNVYLAEIQPGNLLAPERLIERIDMMRATGCHIEMEVQWKSSRAGALHGFAGWYDANLGGGLRLNNLPGASRLMGRKRFWPVLREIPVKAGDEIRVEMNISPTLYFWTTIVRSHDEVVAHLDQSTLQANPRWSELVGRAVPPNVRSVLLQASHDPTLAASLRFDEDHSFDWSIALDIMLEESASLLQGRFTGPQSTFK